MKPYFAKLIPIEGEIKDGDMVREDHTNRLAIHLSFGSDTGMSMLEYLDDGSIDCSDMFKKVKLFLCSRDIQVGDRVKLGSQGGTNATADDESSRMWLKGLGGFKVVGEISPEAKWVKEGDEFETRQLKLYASVGCISLVEVEDKKGFSIVKIEILGPCGHFH